MTKQDDAEGVPDVPDLSGVGEVPDLPGVSDVAMPELPGASDLPDLPGVSDVAVPDLPGVSDAVGIADLVDRRPSTLGGKIYLVVVAIGALGLTLVAVGAWRTGVGLLGGGMLLAAVARGLLGNFESGMLRVRSRLFDVLALGGVGLLLVTLALNIPNQP